jgi:predicted ATPase with chaperone activity
VQRASCSDSGRGKLNAELAGGEIQEHCHLDRSCRLLIAQARERLNLTARAVHRALRVARTIADLEAADPENGSGRSTGRLAPLISPKPCSCGARSTDRYLFNSTM